MISAVMTTCVKAQLIEINPARGVTTLTEDKGRDRILTDVELKRLTQTCLASDEPALYPFVIMGIHTGARAGELQSLTWDDIDWKKGAALLTNTKNGDDRLIPVQGRAKEVLVDRYLQPLEGSEDVFWNKNGVTPFTYSRAFRLACNEAKITDFHFHDLRHNFASRLSNGQQINQLTLSAMLGHRSMQMTKRYTHIFDDKVAEIGAEFAAKLDL
jgi:integrase